MCEADGSVEEEKLSQGGTVLVTEGEGATGEYVTEEEGEEG